jgi:hypothetical protein
VERKSLFSNVGSSPIGDYFVNPNGTSKLKGRGCGRQLYFSSHLEFLLDADKIMNPRL